MAEVLQILLQSQGKTGSYSLIPHPHGSQITALSLSPAEKLSAISCWSLALTLARTLALP